ncbi:hypothetical protein FDP22_22200 (plasmid) [Paroceanicella profunda]|uniref:Metallo-beta-lactamase domain-containing protein n=1 Tax=Paroceanicella profunda TaxID=2579971 RepID=A0A5B8G542_9RHOB|nr:MBL fold metallo-hydrolase [Paroceanicella profunda]QDL94589.1 hypothetical protein FDP22_22200 [Paroceanicella profunda]
MSLTLAALPAHHGDALLLSAGSTCVLIDGGPSGVWRRALSPALTGLGRGGPALIDLLMVSHIDADHITGILELTDKLIEDRQSGRPAVARVREAWFNGFTDALALAGPDAARTGSTAAALSSSASPLAGLLPGGTDSRFVLSSVAQGRRLTDALAALAIPRNHGFTDGLALADSRDTDWSCGPLTLRILGPDRAALEALRREWARHLPKILARETARQARAEALASLDRSVFNLSSIVAVAEAGGRRALLTGDARGDMILDGLTAAGFSGPDLHFDILKMPHHGSDRNITEEFLSRVTADHYLVSGDGKHGNPEPGMFEMLFAARRGTRFTLHLTYPLATIRAHRDYAAEDRGKRLAEALTKAPAGCVIEPTDTATGALIEL